jgi:hypothetical protein
MSRLDIPGEVDRFLADARAAFTAEDKAALEECVRDGVLLAARALAGEDVEGHLRHVRARALQIAGAVEIRGWQAYDGLIRRIAGRVLDLALS